MKVVSVVAALAGLTWGALNGITLARRLPHDVFHQIVVYRGIVAAIGVGCMVAIAIEDFKWKKRIRTERCRDQT